MHVVVIGDYPSSPNEISGGVEAHVLYLTQALQCYSDLKLDVITLSRQGTVERTVQHGGVTAHYLPRVSLPGRLSVLGNIRQVRAKVLRLKPDLIHAHIAGEYAEAAARVGLPWVLTLHGIRFLEADLFQGFLNRTYRAWFIKRDELRVVKRARHIISISPFIEETFGEHVQGDFHNIENATAEAFFELPQGKGQAGQLLFVGRLVPRKGVHVLLRAFANLHRQMPEATLRLAGGASPGRAYSKGYAQSLEQYVADAGLGDSVSFLGRLDQRAILREYSNCSALVLSSFLETAPMVIMQALAAGKPVVSTDAGGARYIVEHGQTGLIVPTGDEQALADALCEVLSDKTKSRDMGNRAREVAKQCFRGRVVAAQTRDLYYRILGQATP